MKKKDCMFDHKFVVGKLNELESKLSAAREALKSIGSDKHNIGNDWYGNLKGYPDAVMCRSIAAQALKAIGEEA